MTFPDRLRASVIVHESERFGTSQVGRRRVELRNQRGGFAGQLGHLVPISINPMAVIANAFPIEDAPSCSDIAFRFLGGTSFDGPLVSNQITRGQTDG